MIIDEPATARPGDDLRARRRRRTTDTIRRAAVDLVRARGLDAVTVEMIAEAAGISLRSFFNYFKYKEEALIPPPVDFPADAVAQFLSGRGVLLQDLSALVIAHLREVEPNREDIALIMRLAAESPRLVAARERILAQYSVQFRALLARRLNLPQTHLRVELIAAVAGAAVDVALRRWADGTAPTLTEEIRRALAALEHLFAGGEANE